VPRIIDVSQPVGSATAVWPGDQTFRLAWTLRRDSGDSVNVAAVTLSAHTGTHADGPFHCDDAGEKPAAVPLEAYLGPALVVDVTGRAELDVDAVAGIDLRLAERILFRTRAHTDATAFPASFAALTPALARRLGETGVRLVGTDAPSVDPFDSKTLEAHRILGQGRVAILENLVLAHVRPGRYTLVALPLKLVEADSSPVRAILLEGSLKA
jgi:arylformamidase